MSLDAIAKTATEATAAVKPWLNWARVTEKLQTAVDQVSLSAAEQAKTATTAEAPLLAAMTEMLRRARLHVAAAAPLPNMVGPILATVLDDVGALATESTTADFSAAAAMARYVDKVAGRTSWLSCPDMRNSALQQMLDDVRVASQLPSQTAADKKIAADVNMLAGELLAGSDKRGDSDARSRYLARGLEVLQGVITSPPQVVRQGEPFKPTDELRDTLHRLPPARQEQFKALADRFGDKEVVVPMRFGSSVRVQVGPLLAELLGSGKLDDKDALGKDLLANLTDLSQQECAPGLDRDLLLALGIVHLARPCRTMSQGPSPRTCSAEVVSNLLIRNNPSEYVRIAAGLVSPAGRVQLRSGQYATRVTDSLIEDGTRRTALERVVQAAFMDVAGPRDGKGRYSNLLDRFVDPDSGQEGNDGVYPEQIAKLAAAVLGGRARAFEVDDNNQNAVMADLARRVDQGQQIIVGIDYMGDNHTVLLEDMHKGRSFFWNPWGHREDRSIKIPGIDHHIDNDGKEDMPNADFGARLVGYILPE